MMFVSSAPLSATAPLGSTTMAPIAAMVMPRVIHVFLVPSQ